MSFKKSTPKLLKRRDFVKKRRKINNLEKVKKRNRIRALIRVWDREYLKIDNQQRVEVIRIFCLYPELFLNSKKKIHFLTEVFIEALYLEGNSHRMKVEESEESQQDCKFVHFITYSYVISKMI